MGQWKLIFGNKKEVIKGKNKDENGKVSFFEREDVTYYILTNDSFQFILSKYIIDQDKLNDSIEIDGIYYKKLGNSSQYYREYSSAVYSYLRELKLNPNKDIKSILDVEQLLQSLYDQGRKLMEFNILLEEAKNKEEIKKEAKEKIKETKEEIKETKEEIKEIKKGRKSAK
jgi:hypothetical protein